MKRKYSIINKLRVCLYFLFEHGEAITVHCSKCNSTKIKFEDSDFNGNIYTSTYRCRNCGAVAKNTEVWE